jgi:hypothetical protein
VIGRRNPAVSKEATMKLGIAGLVLLAACSADGLPQPPDPGVQDGPVGLAGVDETGKRRLLVDASRDGGVWWFPQIAPFSAEAGHQGKGLADEMRSLGFVVEELPRALPVRLPMLHRYHIVIRANAFGGYSADEIAAYKDYVANGGSLLLLADHMKFAPPDAIALAFGVDFQGVTQGENFLFPTGTHAVTSGVDPFPYMVGSGIVSAPAAAQIVGRLSDRSFLDLNNNGLRDSTEIAAPAVLAVMAYGQGRIVFCGDVNLWEMIPQPLLKNVLDWF